MSSDYDSSSEVWVGLLTTCILTSILRVDKSFGTSYLHKKSNSSSNDNYFAHRVAEGYAQEISVFTGTCAIQTKITNNVI